MVRSSTDRAIIFKIEAFINGKTLSSLVGMVSNSQLDGWKMIAKVNSERN